MTDYETRVTTVVVLPKNEPLFSELATEVAVVDDSAGDFVELRQQGRPDAGKIAINTEEWPIIREAIDRMMSECRK